jgi:hypothetical protein
MWLLDTFRALANFGSAAAFPFVVPALARRHVAMMCHALQRRLSRL